MKLKYFLRGLASGIVITTMILTISFNARKDDISEHEIIKRAEELGMVKAEDSERLAVTVLPTAEVEVTEEAEITQVVEVTTEPTEEPTAASEPTSEPAVTVTPTPEPTEEPKVTPTPEVVQASEKKVITIVSGMWSDKVARELQSMGVIEDAADFDQYLVRNGYADRLVVGTFEIPEGADYEQIAQIITRK